MQLENVLERLGYSQSDNYKRAVEETPQTTHLFRGLKKTKQINGCYTFHTSRDDQVLPIRAAVYVAKADTEEEARKIHKQLWNFSNAPFLIVVLPHQIRVYTGFDYSANDKTKGEIRSPIESLAEINQVLTSFFADSIDFAKIWKSEAEYLDPNKRVDSRLLENLETLENYLVTKQHLERPIAQALIGKYIYIKYLREREILSKQWLSESNIDLENILGRNATVTELKKLVDKLEERFQGNVFPLDFDKIPSDKSVSIVASIFKGDELYIIEKENKILKQLHLDFKAYDFSYIPIETLSAIYEQFLHAQGKGKKDGAIYTPEPVADYLICEMNSVKPLDLGMKILDPCCGSGIFMVLVYRKLIEKALETSSNNKLKPFELKDILVNSIYGVERNQEACYVAEFSLILMMLNYIDPPELHKNKDFKFPSLHNKNIFVCDFFDDQSEFWKLEHSFDWIIGNPPWKEIKPKDKEENFARNWIKENYKDRTSTGNRISEAFTWRVIDLLQINGLVGLLTPAKNLFNHESKKYRQKFFSDNQVFRITNFANMAFVLFNGRVIVPAATLVYGKLLSKNNRPYIHHYAPFVTNQLVNVPFGKKAKQNTWSIVINESEIQTIAPTEAEQGETKTWKLALWGNYRDEKAITHIKKLFKNTLKLLVKERNWNCSQGSELRNQNSKEFIEFVPSIRGKQQLDANLMKNSGYRFSVDQNALKIISDSNCFLRKGRNSTLDIVKAPHLIISLKYSAYSEEDFVIPHPKLGISCSWEDADYLMALSVILNSSIIQYYLFFQSSAWGVERDNIYKTEIELLAIPMLLDTQVKHLSTLYKRLAKMEIEGRAISEILEILDSEVNNILFIPRHLNILSQEFMNVRLTINKGKTKTIATEPPTDENLRNYAKYLRYELDNFVEGSDIRHAISITTSENLIVCTVELYNSETEIPVKIKKADAQDSQFLEEIKQKLRQQFSQWVYIQRGMRLFSDTQIHICKSPRLIDWTQTQAMYDSDDIIAEMLNRRKS